MLSRSHRSPRNATPHRAARTRLSVEALEAREVPALLVGLTTTDRIVLFDSAAPATILSSKPITGIAANENIVSIDARPADGRVYALSNRNLLYTVNPYSGAATRVSTPPAAFALVGSRTGIDFNPTVDRLRVTTLSEQNFRVDPKDGAIVDGDGLPGVQPDTPLAYAVGDAGSGVNPGIVEVAYTSNFQGATLTTLFAIDADRNALVRIGGVNGTPSPNAGQVFTVGGLGRNVGRHVGFDVSAAGAAFAALTTGNANGKTRLYNVNLATGATASLGLIGNGKTQLDGLTELPRGEIVWAVTQSQRLVSFRASDPGKLLSARALQGLLAGETVSSMDFRPASGELFAHTTVNRILRIDRVTGQVTQLGAQLAPAFAAGPVGLDFNPSADRLRLVNAANDNLRYNPLDFAPVSPADSDLSYIATDVNVGVDPNIVALAYDRNDNDGPTATTLFGIDAALNNLVRQGAVDGNAADAAGGGTPNNGLLTTLGGLGVGVNPTDRISFDISDRGGLGSGAALAVMQLEGETVSKLFAINLTAGLVNQPLGTASVVGTVGGGEVIVAMAIAPPTIQFSAATFTGKESTRQAAVTITRIGGTGAVTTVRLDTLDDTALAGLDYTALVNLVVTFNPGETTKTVVIAIRNDRAPEPTERALLTLSSVTGGAAVLGALTTAQLRILDND